jgi:hypothetical protein
MSKLKRGIVLTKPARQMLGCIFSGGGASSIYCFSIRVHIFGGAPTRFRCIFSGGGASSIYCFRYMPKTVQYEVILAVVLVQGLSVIFGRGVLPAYTVLVFASLVLTQCSMK